MSTNPAAARRRARGGVLVIGGGFGGASVARLLGRRGATIVNAQNSMLFTPMLPEVASGIIELRNVMMPLAIMCPDADVITGRVTNLALEDHEAEVETDGGLHLWIDYDHVVVSVGAVPRTFPIPGLVEHAVGCGTALDALYLRNQLLRLLAAAAVEPDPERRRRHLTFVFVGGGFAGVETLAELRDLARDALRYHPTLRDVPQRWVLVDAAPGILAEIPSQLGQYATDVLTKRGVDFRLGTRLEKVEDGWVTLSDGTEFEAGLLVWTAGVKADPIVAHLGLPLDEGGRVRVSPTLQVDGYENVWALGDCAGGAQHGYPGPGRSPHQPARPPPGPAVVGQPHGLPGWPAVGAPPLSVARPGRHPRPEGGDRRPEGCSPERPAGVGGGTRRPPHAGSGRLPTAAGAQRLDDVAALPQ